LAGILRLSWLQTLLRVQGMNSRRALMPDEATDGLTAQDLADLIEFVAGLR
jgi:hypothetical protein